MTDQLIDNERYSVPIQLISVSIDGPNKNHPYTCLHANYKISDELAERLKSGILEIGDVNISILESKE